MGSCGEEPMQIIPGQINTSFVLGATYNAGEVNTYCD